MDMDAGIENLGRGTTRGMDALLAVVEPGRRSLGTIERIKGLASDIGLARVFAVGNKVTDENDTSFISAALKFYDIPVIGMVPFDETLREADRRGIAPIDLDENSPAVRAIKATKSGLMKRLENLPPNVLLSEES
jgi:CO dehydrogenase maturation factor